MPALSQRSSMQERLLPKTVRENSRPSQALCPPLSQRGPRPGCRPERDCRGQPHRRWSNECSLMRPPDRWSPARWSRGCGTWSRRDTLPGRRARSTAWTSSAVRPRGAPDGQTISRGLDLSVEVTSTGGGVVEGCANCSAVLARATRCAIPPRSENPARRSGRPGLKKGPETGGLNPISTVS
jgi:hypothetical protein